MLPVAVRPAEDIDPEVPVLVVILLNDEDAPHPVHVTRRAARLLQVVVVILNDKPLVRDSALALAGLARYQLCQILTFAMSLSLRPLFLSASVRFCEYWYEL